MEFEGKVFRLLEPVQGTSARGPWKKQEVIFEQDGEFGKKVCVSFWGDKAEDAGRLKEGEKAKVSVNIESREFNGRWFTEIRAWRIQSLGDVMPSPEIMPPFGEEYSSAPASTEESFDDLPF